MNKSKTNTFLRRAFLFAAAYSLLALTACATAPAGEDRQVVDRAQARWEAVIGGELEEAYGFNSPGYRSTTSLIDYATAVRLRKVRYTSAEYLDHQCEQNRCTVRFNVGFRVFTPVPGMTKFDSKQVIEETWVRTSGEWWYLPDN